jgi:hypothetical protein
MKIYKFSCKENSSGAYHCNHSEDVSGEFINVDELEILARKRIRELSMVDDRNPAVGCYEIILSAINRPY